MKIEEMEKAAELLLKQAEGQLAKGGSMAELDKVQDVRKFAIQTTVGFSCSDVSTIISTARAIEKYLIEG